MVSMNLKITQGSEWDRGGICGRGVLFLFKFFW
jgi:hypothetical protein